jgi:hypothetical protein
MTAAMGLHDLGNDFGLGLIYSNESLGDFAAAISRCGEDYQEPIRLGRN